MITWIKVSRVKTSVLQFRWKKIRLHTCTIGDVNVRYHWMYCRTCRVCSHFDLDVPTEIRHRLTPLPPIYFLMVERGREGAGMRGSWRGVVVRGSGPLAKLNFFFTNYSKKLPKICLGPPPNSYNRRTPPPSPPGGKNLDPRMRRYMYMNVNIQWMMCIFLILFTMTLYYNKLTLYISIHWLDLDRVRIRVINVYELVSYRYNC